MDAQTSSVKKVKTVVAAGETEHQLKKQLIFSAPALDTETKFIPQTNLPVLSDIIILNKGKPGLDPNRPFPVLDKVSLLARQAIEAKAKELPWVGEATSILEQTGQGFVIHYEAADIYYSAATGAHEVHGDIRALPNSVEQFCRKLVFD